MPVKLTRLEPQLRKQFSWTQHLMCRTACLSRNLCYLLQQEFAL